MWDWDSSAGFQAIIRGENSKTIAAVAFACWQGLYLVSVREIVRNRQRLCAPTGAPLRVQVSAQSVAAFHSEICEL